MLQKLLKNFFQSTRHTPKKHSSFSCLKIV
ncbi:protein of unknown function [Trichlorobacter ammonificans]|uniref:Uncharacterized protein n=1 Tax=Trichlorobacter ammonificans TaxID=2916410 RepID=A0ABN8HGB9_9BACT|nr:protein of unknown function [Trichlorobacter ammonificans]